MTLGELYRAAKTALEPVTEDPTFEAACLLEHFCGANRTALLLHGDKPAESEAEQAVLSALEKRKTGEPLQYLLGEWDFEPDAFLRRGRADSARGHRCFGGSSVQAFVENREFAEGA